MMDLPESGGCSPPLSLARTPMRPTAILQPPSKAMRCLIPRTLITPIFALLIAARGGRHGTVNRLDAITLRGRNPRDPAYVNFCRKYIGKSHGRIIKRSLMRWVHLVNISENVRLQLTPKQCRDSMLGREGRGSLNASDIYLLPPRGKISSDISCPATICCCLLLLLLWSSSSYGRRWWWWWWWW